MKEVKASDLGLVKYINFFLKNVAKDPKYILFSEKCLKNRKLFITT